MTAPAPTIAALAARLIHHAQMEAAFGPCQESDDLLLAASVLIELEQLLNVGLEELDRSVTELARVVYA